MNSEEAPHVVETPGGLSVRYRGRLLYSERDPARLPRRTALSADPGPARLLLVCSPLLWYGLPELLQRAGPGSVALCVEADPSLARLSREKAPPGLLDDPRVVFLEARDAEEAVSRARSLGSFRSCSRLDLSGAASLNAGLYARMASLLSAEIESLWRSRAALTVFGRLWARNIMDNIAALPELELRAFPRFEGPAVICGAGPSLEEALPFIAANRERISVLACDTALGPMLTEGVKPDLVVCLEAQIHNLADFVPLGRTAMPLAADLSSHPASFRALHGPKHLSFVRLAPSPFLGRVAALGSALGLPWLELPPLGSVGVHAAYLARSLASGPLFATGLDFSFEVGKTHARGSPSLLAEERRLERLCRWPGQYAVSFRTRTTWAPCPALGDGRRLLSDPILLSYATLLREVSGGSGPALYDIRGRGPDIGARPIGLGQAAALLGGEARSLPGPALAPRPPDLRVGLASFLEEELLRLDRLTAALKGRSTHPESDLAGLLANSDYLYWSFPDAERAGALPQDFLNRLLPEIEYWSWRLRALAASLPRD
ncbi:MAG TPA: 6-hydroxymethylpterin diphosphokinase MptE-like protein [Rectinemataceae bacterium]|nr:6-hydroxymethylpterin diphosphokinase MptE-like protein [Rectinemataceae bacterium]